MSEPTSTSRPSSPSPNSPAPRNKRIEACRCCGSPELDEVFSLGEHYINSFPLPGEERSGPKCPIEIVACRACKLVQQRWSAPPELLYSGGYWYRSSVTETMKNALKDVVDSATKLVNLGQGSVVLDVGSNDGTMLRMFPDWLYRMGVEPASNLVTSENYQGLQVINAMWPLGNGPLPGLVDERNRQDLFNLKAKIVTAIGMLYDAEDPRAFIADVAKVLHPEGVFIAQLMCLKQMVEKNDVGNLCHEHLEFWPMATLVKLFEDCGLHVFRVDENDVNGGSYRLYARHSANQIRGQFKREGVPPYEPLLTYEDPSFLRHWIERLGAHKARCRQFVRNQVSSGRKVWVFGASTKGNTILQWLAEPTPGDDDPYLARYFEAAADRSPEKVGRVMVGTGIPIRSEADFRAASPDFALVLPYTFLPEMMERERAWLDGGGCFVTVVPSFKVIGRSVQ